MSPLYRLMKVSLLSCKHTARKYRMQINIASFQDKILLAMESNSSLSIEHGTLTMEEKKIPMTTRSL
jgi:hypothetical protein